MGYEKTGTRRLPEKEGYGMAKQKSAAKSACIVVSLVLVFLLIALLVCYFLTASYYADHFFPGTVLNGTAVGKMTVEEAENKVAQEVADYIFSIETRDGEKYQIIGPDIDYAYAPGSEISDILKAQEKYHWLTKRKGKKDIHLEVSAVYDADKLDQAVAKLPCFQSENVTKPRDAYLQKTDSGYELVEAVEGNQLLLEKVQKLAREAVDAGEDRLVLTDKAYKKPKVASDDKELKQALDNINSYLHTTIKYDVGENGEVLDYETIGDWITVGEDYTVAFDESRVTNYVQYLASKYNTYGAVRNFKTSLGDTVQVGGGDYGWVIQKEKEAQLLKENILSGAPTVREPVYSQRAKVEGFEDIGKTYLEIDYTKQHMWYYEDGQMILESDIVSGNIATGNGSPDGIFKIVYKQSPAVLKGEDYESNVDFFMPFAYNVGVHDASWRTEFGGEFYKTTGSHGCINAPREVAETLYQRMKVDTPVVAYYREPVELTAENCKISNAYSYVEPPEEEE